MTSGRLPIGLVLVRRPEHDPGAGDDGMGVLVDRQQDTSGDYGYDLAHEATGRKEAVGDRTGSTAGEGFPADEGQDLGYDEAHDF